MPSATSNTHLPSAEVSWAKEFQSEDLIRKLEHQTNLRLIVESENSRLKSRISEMQELEKMIQDANPQFPNHHNMQLKAEIENLRLRLRILTEENELLRARLQERPEPIYKTSQESYKKAELTNKELLRELSEFKDAYEDLRKLYANDIASQKSRYEDLIIERNKLEAKLKDFSIRDPEALDSMQDKIKKIKNDYRDKIKQLEQRIQPEVTEHISDARLKEIEARLAVLQSKLIDQPAFNEKALMRKTAQKSSRASPRSEYSPYATWRTQNVSPNLMDSGKNSPFSNRSPRNTQRIFKENFKSSRGRGEKHNASKSPARTSTKSPDNRNCSGLRNGLKGKECGTCVRKHGQDWTKRFS